MKSSHEKEKLLLKQKEKCGENKQLNNNELDIYIYSSCRLGRASLNSPDLAQSGVSGLRGRVILETFEPSLGGSSWPDPAVILSCIHDEHEIMLG